MYDIIVFENLRLRPPTRKQKAGVFKNLHSEEHFWKDAFSVTVFTGYVWTVDQIGGINIRFQMKTYTCGRDLSSWALSIQPKIPEISVGTPNRTDHVGPIGTSFKGGPLWPVCSFLSVGPKCPFPFDKIVVHSAALLHPAYKNNNQTRGGLGRVCPTGMYSSIGHVKFLKFQTGIFVEWKAPHVSLLCTSATHASVLTKLPHSGLFLDIFSRKVSWRYPRIREQTRLTKRLNSATATCQLLSSIRQLWVHVFRAHRDENKFKNIIYWNFGIKK